jgi:hypothetical protein
MEEQVETLATVLWRAGARDSIAPVAFRDVVRMWNEAHGKGQKDGGRSDAQDEINAAFGKDR